MVAYLHFIHCICFTTITLLTQNNTFPETNLEENYEIKLIDRILLHIHNCLLPSLYSGPFQVNIMFFVVEFAITFL